MKKLIKEKIFNNLFAYKLFRIYQNFNLYKNSYPIRDIAVCGMPRSGSTLMFNIIKKVIETKNNKTDTFTRNDKQYKILLKYEISSLVKKVHSYSPFLARRIKKRKTIGFFTHRDIRDIVVSEQQKGVVENPDSWKYKMRLRSIVNNALLYAKGPNMYIVSYEKLKNKPGEVIKKVSYALDATLSQEEIDQIKEALSIKNVKNELKQIPEEKRRNFSNQLHKNHIADGKTGKWKKYLSKQQINKITKESTDFLKYFNYEI